MFVLLAEPLQLPCASVLLVAASSLLPRLSFFFSSLRFSSASASASFFFFSASLRFCSSCCRFFSSSAAFFFFSASLRLSSSSLRFFSSSAFFFFSSSFHLRSALLFLFLLLSASLRFFSSSAFFFSAAIRCFSRSIAARSIAFFCLNGLALDRFQCSGLNPKSDAQHGAKGHVNQNSVNKGPYRPGAFSGAAGHVRSVIQGVRDQSHAINPSLLQQHHSLDHGVIADAFVRANQKFRFGTVSANNIRLDDFLDGLDRLRIIVNEVLLFRIDMNNKRLGALFQRLLSTLAWGRSTFTPSIEEER